MSKILNKIKNHFKLEYLGQSNPERDEKVIFNENIRKEIFQNRLKEKRCWTCKNFERKFKEGGLHCVGDTKPYGTCGYMKDIDEYYEKPLVYENDTCSHWDDKYNLPYLIEDIDKHIN